MEDNAEFSFEQLSQCRKYVTTCRDLFKDFHANAEETCRAQKAVEAIVAMTQRLDKLCTGRAVKALIDRALEGKDYKAVLPEKYHPVGHALQINWVEEMPKLENAEMVKLAGFATMCEAALSFGATDLWSEGIFEGKRKECNDFVFAFQTALSKAVDQEGSAMMSPVESFLDKYGAVMQCVDEWKLKDIDWIYKSESEQEIKQDINGFREAWVAATDFSTRIDSLVKFKSQCKTTQALFDKCSELRSKLQEKGLVGCKLCLYMMFSTVAVDGGTSAEDVEATEKYTKKKFNMGREVLGEKLQSLLKALRSKKTVDPEQPKRKAEHNAEGDRKAKKEKSEKKDKKEKDRDKKEKDKKSKKSSK